MSAKLTAEQIAAVLRKQRPVDLFSNHIARLTWYAYVTVFADELRDRNPNGFNAWAFFDICGVPS